MPKEKILMIRFSSFGDITQCLSVPSLLKRHFNEVEVHWVTREDMAPLLEGHPAIQRIWKFSRQQGLLSLLRLALELRAQKFTRVYDAHNNLRSHVITMVLRFPWIGGAPVLLRRSIRRWKRWLLFKFRVNLFEMPFSGQRDLIEPLQSWGIAKTLPKAPQLFLSAEEVKSAAKNLPTDFIALAPSAAFALKRWPPEYWKSLIMKFPQQKFVLLGGPQDQFLSEIAALDPQRVINLAGHTQLRESAAVIANAKAVVSNDTGLLHVAEQLGVPSIALMGPAPFGFPSRSSTRILELDLPCRPCSKHGQGPCRNPVFQQCLRGISADTVAQELRQIVNL
jgi:lipopolysaccharide heptosyltransferase II